MRRVVRCLDQAAIVETREQGWPLRGCVIDGGWQLADERWAVGV
jgi:hypothetical protein